MARSTYLRIYLQDMEAVTRAGCRLARRALGSNRATAFEQTLTRVVDVLSTDRAAHLSVMHAAGVHPNPLKDAAALAAETLGRLKLNGEWLSYSPLSRVLELHGLLAVVSTRTGFWVALARLAATDPRFDRARAEEQQGALQDLIGPLQGAHLEAATQALTPS